jgi:hypothetical protein
MFSNILANEVQSHLKGKLETYIYIENWNFQSEQLFILSGHGHAVSRFVATATVSPATYVLLACFATAAY